MIDKLNSKTQETYLEGPDWVVLVESRYQHQAKNCCQDENN